MDTSGLVAVTHRSQLRGQPLSKPLLVLQRSLLACSRKTIIAHAVLRGSFSNEKTIDLSIQNHEYLF